MRLSPLGVLFFAAGPSAAATAQVPVNANPTPPPPKPTVLPVPATLPKGAGGPGLHLESKLGSFKIKKGSEQLDVGIFDIDFTGTILVSGLKGQAVPGKGVKLEYDRPDHNKKVFYGKGHLHVDGNFDGIQWFGRDMNAIYRGTGVIQLFGEFDKDLNTGDYWYGEDKQNKRYWGTGGATITPMPFKAPGEDVKVTVTKPTPAKASEGKGKPKG